MCVAQTKAPSQTPINRLARLLKNKGLRENADFTGKGEGAGAVRLVSGGVCVVYVRGASVGASTAVERRDPSP